MGSIGATQYLIFLSAEAVFGAEGGSEAAAARTGVRSMPQIGQVPGASRTTFGCIPQV